MGDSEYCVFSGGSYSGSAPAGIEAHVYEELKASTVKVVHGRSSGSGFVLDSQDHVSTDAHVALNGRRLQILTPHGPIEATIEKLNVVDDIAILHAPGLKQAGFRPVTMKADAGVQIGMTGYSIGFPKSQATDVPCISHGPVVFQGTLMEIVRRAYPDADFLTNLDLLPLAQGREGLPAFVFNHRDSYIGRAGSLSGIILKNDLPQLLGDGLSGGPFAAEDAEVMGMNASILNGQELRATPVNKIVETQRQPSRLNFVYESGRLVSVKPLDRSDKVASDDAAMANLLLEQSDRLASK